MTEPRTAAGRALYDEQHWGEQRFSREETDGACALKQRILAIEAEAILAIEAEAASPDSEALRAALSALVTEIEHEAKYGAGLIYTWVHESNMEQARAALTPEAKESPK
jgi:hypothetical protein